jgi:DNA-binding transcriptional regulator LsrR (DeoR family)
MKTVELYARVRHAVLIEGISERAAADRFGINARTVSKMLKFSVPPGYVRRKPPFRPKLDEFTGVIDTILATDRERPKKQRLGVTYRVLQSTLRKIDARMGTQML